MDYEKKYNEALERAKELIALLDKVKLQATQADIYEIFPELCESEGERIRKTLMDIVGRIVERAFTEEGVTKTSVLAWLEKQKPVYDTTFEKWLDDWYQGSKEAGGDVVMSEAEFKNWSRGIRNMYQQKPVEVKDPFSNANFVRGYESGYNDAIREQKPVEWSKEDENKLNHILEIVHIASGSEASVDEKEELESFLKSLRPSWKPNKEQMVALQDSIDLDKTVFRRGKLVALLEDLKKLM